MLLNPVVLSFNSDFHKLEISGVIILSLSEERNYSDHPDKTVPQYKPLLSLAVANSPLEILYLNRTLSRSRKSMSLTSGVSKKRSFVAESAMYRFRQPSRPFCEEDTLNQAEAVESKTSFSNCNQTLSKLRQKSPRLALECKGRTFNRFRIIV